MSPLFEVRHADEAVSSTEKYKFGPTFNKILNQTPKGQLLILRHAGRANFDITVAAYPAVGSPQIKIKVNPFLGKYLVVKARMSVTGGGTFSLQYRIEAPVATENTGGTINATGTTDVGYISSVDLSTLGGSDRRGVDGLVNLYFKTTAGTGTLKGLVVSQSEDISGSHQYCLWG